MDAQQQIIEDIMSEVAQGRASFGLTPDDGLAALRTDMKEWMGIPSNTYVIVAWRVSLKDGNVIVVTKKDDQYQIGRFFTIGKQWQFSSDAEGTVEKVMQRMMDVL